MSINEPTLDTKIRYCVVGAGNIAQVAVLPAFANAGENSELVAIISSDPEKRVELQEKYGIEHAGGYEDLEQVLQNADVDAVYIALPNHMHREYTERCARAGVHVLVEKPMATTVADCEAMIDACEAAGVKLMIAYRLHFEETNLRAIEAIQKGVIGDARYFSSVFSHDVRPDDIRTKGDVGGGALLDLGVYCINAARYLFADEPEEIFGVCIKGTDPRFQDVDEMTSVIMRFPGERIAQFTCNQGTADVSELRVVGTKGDICLEPAYEYSEGLTMFTTVDEKTKKKSFKKRDQFAPELVYFSQCILDDTEPEPNGQEGLADIRIIEAIFESAASGQTVKLAPFVKDVRPSMNQNIKKRAISPPEPVNAPSPSK